MKNNIRIGKISSINYEMGMVKVTYPDRNDEVTKEIPYLSNGEYWMPQKGDSVVVAHLENGPEAGICIGTIHNEGQMPDEGGKELFSKKLNKECEISADGKKLKLKAGNDEVEVGEVKKNLEELKKQVKNLDERVKALGG